MKRFLTLLATCCLALSAPAAFAAGSLEASAPNIILVITEWVKQWLEG